MNLHDLPREPGLNTGRYDDEWFAELPWHSTDITLEVAGVAENLQPDGTTECERLDGLPNDEPDFWSVYFHTDQHPDYGHFTEVLGDYPTRDAALRDAEAIRAEYCPEAFIEDLT